MFWFDFSERMSYIHPLLMLARYMIYVQIKLTNVETVFVLCHATSDVNA
jgi:hypothetical protein